MARTSPVLCATKWHNPRPDWLDRWLAPGVPLPLIGEPHREHDSNPPEILHRHVDWRFVDEATFQAAAYPNTSRGWVSTIIEERHIAATEVLELPQLRSFPEWPLDLYGGAYDAWHEFQERFRTARLDCGKCPHMQFDLSNIAPDRHGNKLCPLHGLRFRPDGALDYQPRPESDMEATLRFCHAEMGAMRRDRGLPVTPYQLFCQVMIAQIHLERVRSQTAEEFKRRGGGE